MKKEYLVELCRAFLYGESITVDAKADLDALYKLSKVHNLSAVAFCALNTANNKDDLPREALKRFENDFLDDVIRYDFQSRQKAEIAALCENEGIRCVFFKGAELRELYPVPEARVMSDVDVLIDKESRDKLKSVLTSNGFTCRASNGNVYEYTKDELLTEVHTRIISGKIGENDIEEYFKDAINHAEFDGCAGTLDNNYHFAYLIAHTAHHFWFYGAGAKLILDLAVMLTRRDIDLDEVLEILNGCGLRQFAEVILTVTFKWFGCGRDFGSDTAETEHFLLSYGAFGNSGRNKAAVVRRKALENGEESGFKAKLSLLFPSYEKMKNIPYISFIEGRRYLVPAAWLYRIYYNFKNRREFVGNATRTLSSDETKNEAERELGFFREIGLL